MADHNPKEESYQAQIFKYRFEGHLQNYHQKIPREDGISKEMIQLRSISTLEAIRILLNTHLQTCVIP